MKVVRLVNTQKFAKRARTAQKKRMKEKGNNITLKDLPKEEK